MTVLQTERLTLRPLVAADAEPYAAGDVNGDGFADLVVGAWLGDGGGGDAGEAYVVFGKASGFGSTVSGRSVVDLSNLAPASGFIVRGDIIGDTAGRSVSWAGAVNGDGFADLIVGAPGGDDGGNYAGEAYGVRQGVGVRHARRPRPLGGRPDGSHGRQRLHHLGRAVEWEAMGFSVSSAGDFNGDGFADLIVASPYASANDLYPGEAYVVFGKASGSARSTTGTAR